MPSNPSLCSLCCCLCCPPPEARRFCLAFRKVDSLTARPLSGARFILAQGRRVVARAVSDAGGRVRFCGLRPGQYTVAETTPAPGYRPDFRRFAAVVDETGAAFIAGVRACRFRWGNRPLAGGFELRFLKKGMTTMAIPLQGATFQLLDGGTPILTATSDENGLVALGAVSPGTYTLVETQTPDGFLPGGPYTVVVSPTGDITVDGLPLADFAAENLPFPNFAFGKTDAGGLPLAGGVFALDDLSGTIQHATSTADGTVTFYGLRPGQYLLSEDTPPFGYIPDPTVYLVEVSDTGTITVGGADPTGFAVINEAGPVVAFVKMDMTPQSAPPVLDPVRNGVLPVTGAGVPDSGITLTWPGGGTSAVTVGLDGRWEVIPSQELLLGQSVSAVQDTPNHLPSDAVTQPVQQASTPPPITVILVGDAQLTGLGEPGSSITVLWPDGSTGSTTVEGDTTWGITPPGPFVLGQVVRAYQTTPPMLPSAIESMTVQQVSPLPVLEPVTEGDPVLSGAGLPGASIAITWPGGAPGAAGVGAYGTWIAFPPAGLVAGQEITATQTAPGMIESGPASVTVQGPPS